MFKHIDDLFAVIRQEVWESRHKSQCNLGEKWILEVEGFDFTSRPVFMTFFLNTVCTEWITCKIFSSLALPGFVIPACIFAIAL